MADIETAKRYALAAFELADESAVLEKVNQDLLDLINLVKDSADFEDLILNPLIDSNARQTCLKELLSGKVDELTLRFLCFLDSKGRLNALVDVAEQFNLMYLDKLNIIRAVVVSASAMEATELDQIRQRLEKRFNKNIQLSTDLRDDLIGGFLVKVGDTVFDYSVKHQLENVKQKIVSAHSA